MRSATPALVEFANKDGENWSHERDHAEQPEAVKKTKHRSLLLHHCVHLCNGSDGGVGRGIPAFNEVALDACESRGESSAVIANACDENTVMVLRPCSGLSFSGVFTLLVLVWRLRLNATQKGSVQVFKGQWPADLLFVIVVFGYDM
jgi:hypothetical protein